MRFDETITGIFFVIVLIFLAIMMTITAITTPTKGYCVANTSVCETSLTTTINGRQY